MRWAGCWTPAVAGVARTRPYGAPTWFALGDRDLATHLVRTRALRDGRSLSTITAELARALGVTSRMLPMSDDPVRTMIQTPDGWLGFQEYFVRDKCQVEVVGVDYEGAARAKYSWNPSRPSGVRSEERR